MKPFLKWAGGKTQLLPELMKRVPAKFGTYYEPFLGGGAMFFALQPKRAVLSDVNRRLIRTYRGVRDSVEVVVGMLQAYEDLHSEEFYYKMRSRDVDSNDSDAGLAAWMIYLNKTGFNGLYRVNKSGKFNVPWGKHEKFVPDVENLRACSAALKNKQLLYCPFEFVFNPTAAKVLCPVSGDLVYMDPPYVPVSKTASFTAYTASGFDGIDQDRVVTVARNLKARGVHIILSNSGTEGVAQLYAEGFEVEEVAARRSINSKGSARGPVKEYIIT